MAYFLVTTEDICRILPVEGEEDGIIDAHESSGSLGNGSVAHFAFEYEMTQSSLGSVVVCGNSWDKYTDKVLLFVFEKRGFVRDEFCWIIFMNDSDFLELLHELVFQLSSPDIIGRLLELFLELIPNPFVEFSELLIGCFATIR